MRAAWSSPTTRITIEEGESHDPGTGPDRYRRALEILRSGDQPMALAAFTFDVDEPGSVVMIPGTEAPYPDRTPPPPGRIVDDGRKRWWSGFDDALAALGSGEVEKVVLARRAVGRFETNLEPASVWRTLVDANPDTYCFLFDGFVGASPELLVRVDGDRVQSLALAGTAATARGLAGEKIASEHQHTADSVTEALAPITLGLATSRDLHRFGGLTHVGTWFEGRLQEGFTVLDVLAAIHPTAAVAGTPRDAAVRLIRRLEEPRGLYCGPVGWFDRDGNGEFAIALRCGHIEGNEIVLHAGGGLLLGSDRDREWKETELKLRPMLSALGLEG